MSIGPAPFGSHHMAAAALRPGLPRPLSSFIGRQREISEIGELLRNGAVRLLTLVGPGGVGKTRLAIEVASRVESTFPDGVWFVDLTFLSDPTQVIPGIARALGLREFGDEPIALRLRAFLRDRHALLVLDNLEQVISAAPDLANLLLDCPELVILATSREPLAIDGEQECPIAPLATGPDDGSKSDVPQAIQLFAERARAGVPDFTLTGDIAPVVAEICRRLDGLPLAIELAAARVKSLPPRELLARLDQRLPLLIGTRRDAPRRQQTMRDTIGWSYDMLTANEQVLFQRLSVFVGGFTLETAAAVADNGALTLLDGIASLVDKNLLGQRESPSGDARYSMLETIREYGLEQLRLTGDLNAARSAHADAMRHFVNTHASPVTMSSLAARQLALERGNVRAALSWCLETRSITTGMRLAAEYARTWRIMGLLSEGRRWLDEFLAAETGETPLEIRARARLFNGWLAWMQGDVAVTEACSLAVLAMVEPPSWPVLRAHALMSLGVLALMRDKPDDADALYQQAIALARQDGHDPEFERRVNEGLAIIAWNRGDLATAESLFREDLDAARALDDDFSVTGTLSNLSALLRSQGKIRQAATFDRERLAINRALADPFQLSDCCQAAAAVSLASGSFRQAARLASVAARVRTEIGLWGDPGYQREIAATENAIRAALPEDDFQQEWHAGWALPLDIAIAEADAVFAEDEAGSMSGASPADPVAAYGLTPRETEVLRLMVAGLSNTEIGDRLFISTRTAQTHVTHILAKLDVTTRTKAAAKAVREGLERDGQPI